MADAVLALDTAGVALNFGYVTKVICDPVQNLTLKPMDSQSKPMLNSVASERLELIPPIGN